MVDQGEVPSCLQSWTKVNVTPTKNGIFFRSHKQLKTLLRDNMVKLKIISLYI